MPICITGMHRSGTSMVARVLQICGVYLGEEDELFAGRPDNPEGFFENRRFYAVNDRILEVFGSTWDLPKPFPENWQDDERLDPIYEDAKKLVAEFDAHGVWGWKDPRSSLTLAFWKKIIPDLKTVVCLRNPVDVCASLTKRGYASTKFGLDLWWTYTLALQKETDRCNSISTHYASYFHDPESEIERLVQFCKVSSSADQFKSAVATIDRKLRHSDSGVFELIAAKADLHMVNAYVQACLDSGHVFESVYRKEMLTLAGTQERLDAAANRVREIKEELKAKEESLIAELNRTIDEGRDRMMNTIAIKDESINGLQSYIDLTVPALRKRISELEAAVDAASQSASAASKQVQDIHASRSWKIATRITGLLRSTPAPTPSEQPPAPALPAATHVPEPSQPSGTGPLPVLHFLPKELRNFTLAQYIERFRRAAEHEAALERQKLEVMPQSRLGHKLMPPGGAFERAVRKIVRTKEVAREYGGKYFLKKIARKLIGRPTPLPYVKALPEPVVETSSIELMETIRHDLVDIERATYVARNHKRAVRNMLEKGFKHGPNYVPLDEDMQAPVDAAVKLIAFYLTQFHPVAENNKWWGKGFTEWTNVSKAVPVYDGQYQPHLPDELGFYDLRIDEVQERQVELARKYGLHGFAFYYYWFAGKRLLERPLDSFVNNPNIDFPFCLIWANENWTRRWDGRQDDVLMAQQHSPESDVRFIEDLRPYLEHKNYIRLGGRPLIMVYRPDQLPDPKHTAERWRAYCLTHDLGNPILIACQTFGFENPDTIGFDAAMQFPPHNEHSGDKFQLDYRSGRVRLFETEYAGCICSYPALVREKCNDENRRMEDGFILPEPEKKNYPVYETAFPMWDNTPRLPLSGVNFAFSSPDLYKVWLQRLCLKSIEAEPVRDNRLVFINAWNEWAEGAHLEPDRRYGYAYLKATREALDFAKRMEEGSATPSAITLPPDPEIEELTKRKPHSPIFVFQMGKVGSTSVYEKLAEMDLAEPVFHLHLLHNVDRISRYVCKRFSQPEGSLFYLRRGKIVRDWMSQADDKVTWNVITGVREPVAYNVSAFFEMLPYMVPNIAKRFEADDICVEELHELFLHQMDHWAPAVWFNVQFKPVFGIDVYKTPFAHEAGYKIYEESQSRLLVLRVEDLNRSVGGAMREFMGLEDFTAPVRNRSEDKLYHDLAERFKQKPLPADYVDRVLGTQYATHFYTTEELSQARQKWTHWP